VTNLLLLFIILYMGIANDTSLRLPVLGLFVYADLRLYIIIHIISII